MHHRRTHSPRPAAAFAPRTVLLALLCVAQLMVILDISAVNVALPSLAKDLGISGSDISWTITSYSLIYGSLLLLGGRAADLLGRRRVFLAGLAVFTIASLASAVSGTSAALFAARAGQGVGAAMLSPAALSIIMSTFRDGHERTRALATWGAVGGAGAALGVLLGGVLTEFVDWRAIFLINLPVGAAIAVMAARIIPADPASPKWRGLDLRGAALAVASLGGLVYALSQAESAGWTSIQTLGIGAGALGGVASFVALELRVEYPLLQVRRLKDRAVGGGFALMLAASAVLFGTFLLTSLYLQNVLGTSPLETGLAFIPMALATGAGAHVGSQLVRHAGVRVPMAGAFAAATAGLLLLSGVQDGGGYFTDVLPGLVVTGLGLGVALVCVAVAVMSGAAEEESGMFSGLNTTGHEIGGSLGIAVLLTIATGALGGVAGHGPATGLAAGLADAYFAAGMLAAIASVAALVVLPSARTFLPTLRLAPSMPIH
jgi:EmrB/QacA subfamily drug resistance transporter